MLPWAIAVTGNRRNMTTVLLVNLLFGWTVLGWIVALVMAVAQDSPMPASYMAVFQAP